MKQEIIDIAKKYDADFVGFAPASRFDKDDNIFKIFPDTKTVITLGFRVLRGIYKGVEEGTTFYQYTTMGVENLEETVMPLAMLGVCNVLEDEDYYAFPQKNNQLIMESENETNPEMDYTEIMRGIKKELQIDFKNAAVKCGIGEMGLHGAVLTDEFGPFQRFCCILTDAKIEADEVKIGGRPLLTEEEVQLMAELYIDKLKIANQDRPKVVAKLDKYIERFNVKKFMRDNPDLTHPDFYMVIFNETDKLVQ